MTGRPEPERDRGAARRAAGRPAGLRSASAQSLAPALAEAGCPICRCVEADARRNLAAWLRELTMDPQGRAALRAAGGFCAWHTGMLRDAADGILSVALLAEDLLASPVASRGACPACTPLAPRTVEYIQTLVFGPDAAALQEALARGPALLCQPHLRWIRGSVAPRAGLAGLEAAVAARLARLRAALAGFIRSQDYRSREKPTAEEAQAWSEALEHLAGRGAWPGSDLAEPWVRPSGEVR